MVGRMVSLSQPGNPRQQHDDFEGFLVVGDMKVTIRACKNIRR
jgi:hypothetical protein